MYESKVIQALSKNEDFGMTNSHKLLSALCSLALNFFFS